MEVVWILTGLTFYLKLNSTLLKILHLEPSSKNLITYALLGFLVSAFIVFCIYYKSSKSSSFLFIFYIFGLSIQIAYWYFKKPRKKPFENK